MTGMDLTTIIAVLAGLATVIAPALTIMVKMTTLVEKITTLTDSHHALVQRVEDVAEMVISHITDHPSITVAVPPSHAVSVAPVAPAPSE